MIPELGVNSEQCQVWPKQNKKKQSIQMASYAMLLNIFQIIVPC